MSASHSHHRPTPLSELIEPDEFTRRHVGPSPDDVAHMLSTIAVVVDRRVARRHDAGLDRRSWTARPPGRRARTRGTRERSASHRLEEPAGDEPDRHGLHRHDHPAGDRPQRARESRLVHGLHAVPTRDQPGSTRGAAQLPDAGDRADRARCRQRITARRGNGSRRGDDDGTPSVEVGLRSIRRPPRHPSADDRRAADPSRAGRHRPRRRRRRSARHTTTACSARCSACRHRPAPSSTGPMPSPRSTPTAESRSW